MGQAQDNWGVGGWLFERIIDAITGKAEKEEAINRSYSRHGLPVPIGYANEMPGNYAEDVMSYTTGILEPPKKVSGGTNYYGNDTVTSEGNKVLPNTPQQGVLTLLEKVKARLANPQGTKQQGGEFPEPNDLFGPGGLLENYIHNINAGGAMWDTFSRINEPEYRTAKKNINPNTGHSYLNPLYTRLEKGYNKNLPPNKRGDAKTGTRIPIAPLGRQ